jgi:hypothetical protein
MTDSGAETQGNEDFECQITNDLATELSALAGISSTPVAENSEFPRFSGAVLRYQNRPVAAIGFARESGSTLGITDPLFFSAESAATHARWTHCLLKAVRKQAVRFGCTTLRSLQPAPPSTTEFSMPGVLADDKFTVQATVDLLELEGTPASLYGAHCRPEHDRVLAPEQRKPAIPVGYRQHSSVCDRSDRSTGSHSVWLFRPANLCATQAVPVCNETRPEKAQCNPSLRLEVLAPEQWRTSAPANEAVREVLSQILVSTKDLSQLPVPDAEALLADWAMLKSTIVNVRTDERIIGLCVCTSEPELSSEDDNRIQLLIHYVGVVPELRRRGVAEWVIAALPALSVMRIPQWQFTASEFSATTPTAPHRLCMTSWVLKSGRATASGFARLRLVRDAAVENVLQLVRLLPMSARCDSGFGRAAK